MSSRACSRSAMTASFSTGRRKAPSRMAHRGTYATTVTSRRSTPSWHGDAKHRPMAEALMKAKPGVVGGFILGAAGLGVAGILFFGGTRMFSRTMQAVAYFSESVAGLEGGSPVTFNGVRIGQVKKVALEFSAATLTARIPVVLEFEPEQITWQDGKRLAEDPKDFQRLVRARLRAQLEKQRFVSPPGRGGLRFD